MGYKQIAGPQLVTRKVEWNEPIGDKTIPCDVTWTFEVRKDSEVNSVSKDLAFLVEVTRKVEGYADAAGLPIVIEHEPITADEAKSKEKAEKYEKRTAPSKQNLLELVNKLYIFNAFCACYFETRLGAKSGNS